MSSIAHSLKIARVRRPDRYDLADTLDMSAVPGTPTGPGITQSAEWDRLRHTNTLPYRLRTREDIQRYLAVAREVRTPGEILTVYPDGTIHLRLGRGARS